MIEAGFSGATGSWSPTSVLSSIDGSFKSDHAAGDPVLDQAPHADVDVMILPSGAVMIYDPWTTAIERSIQSSG